MGNLIFKWISRQKFLKMLIPAYLNFSYEYSFTSNRLWRKNRQKNLGLSSLLLSLCDGVDLNRNFGYRWHEATRISKQSGTQQNCVETYSGSGPFSEPESKNIRNFVSSIKVNVVVR